MAGTLHCHLGFAQSAAAHDSATWQSGGSLLGRGVWGGLGGGAHCFEPEVGVECLVQIREAGAVTHLAEGLHIRLPVDCRMDLLRHMSPSCMLN
jgi:hypothetical protein